jgi:hypothetical protein
MSLRHIALDSSQQKKETPEGKTPLAAKLLPQVAVSLIRI